MTRNFLLLLDNSKKFFLILNNSTKFFLLLDNSTKFFLLLDNSKKFFLLLNNSAKLWILHNKITRSDPQFDNRITRDLFTQGVYILLLCTNSPAVEVQCIFLEYFLPYSYCVYSRVS